MQDERSIISSIAGHTSWAKTVDRTARTAPAREKVNQRREVEVDPELKLDPAEGAKRAANARKAYFKRLALKSAQARRGRDGGDAA